MVKVIIFAILFLREENQDTTPCLLMVYSDAQPVQFWPIECETYNENVHDGVFHKCFCQPWNCADQIVIQLSGDEPPRFLALIIRDEEDAILLNTAFSTDTSLLDDGIVTYNISFVPTDIGICDKKVRFFVYDVTLEEDIAHSDCQYISSSTPDTIIAQYYNHLNVFGLYYAEETPKFNLRIPAIFFHQRFPEEDEVMELTSELVTLNGSMRRQRLLDTDYLPYYFHEKIKLMLKHQFVTIYNKFWTKQESYDIQEGNRMHPERKAKCWISEQEYMQRSVL
jgi:hypothetical protein